MAGNCRMGIIARSVWILVLCSSALHAQATRRLWVLQAPDSIVEYDPATFGQIDSFKVPPQVFKNPGGFCVNRKGQMLFVPRMEDASSAEGDGSAENKIWLWDNQKATLLNRYARYASSPAGSNQTVVEAIPQCVLSEDGKQLYWFENEFSKLMEGSSRDISASTRFRFWQTDLEGGQRQLLSESAFPPCDCGTGVCSETCPEAEVWNPEGGIDDFIIVTNWISGQIGSDYQSSFVSLKAMGRWSMQRLPEPIIAVLDAAQKGTVIVEAIPDSGCCGWDNDSNDQTILSKNGMNMVLFDERRRYANPDYDISFFTSNARLSPNLLAVAMTISSSSKNGKDIRLSSEGKPDQAELERILRTFSELPAVEVLVLGNPPRRSAFIPHASLVGWLNDNEILLIEDHMLIAFNPTTGTRRKSPIRIRQAFDAIVR
jgi:hypothetical protein